MANKLLWILERRVIAGNLHLRQDRHDIAGVSRFAQCVLERLLKHVADPTRGRSDKNAERQRRDFTARFFVAMKLIANLRTVAVHDDDSPAIEYEIYNGPQALARMSKLI